jgi:hypothetical protein
MSTTTLAESELELFYDLDRLTVDEYERLVASGALVEWAEATSCSASQVKILTPGSPPTALLQLGRESHRRPGNSQYPGVGERATRLHT